MKVTRLINPQELSFEEAELPSVEAGAVVVEVAACGLTDSDVKAYLGQKQSHSGILGGQIAATVIAAGENTEWAVGDRMLISRYVACGECAHCRTGHPDLCKERKEVGIDLPGGLQQQLVLDAHILRNGCVAAIPKNLKFEEVCAADVTAAVFKAHKLCGIGPGQKVLILGCGPAGCMHTHIAKLRGADAIVQADRVASRMEMSRPFMADTLLDLSWEDLNEAVGDLTGGMGVDVAIVATDDPGAFAEAVCQTAVGGKILLFSRFGENGSAVEVDLKAIQEKQLQLISSDGYTVEDLKQVLWLASKRKITLKWMITSVCDAEEMPKKMEALEKGKELRIVIHP